MPAEIFDRPRSLLRSLADHGALELGPQARAVFLAAIAVKSMAIAVFLIGRRSQGA
jgi:hypothetical protein